MNGGVEAVPLMPVLGNGHASSTSSGGQRSRFSSSITVPPEMQLTLAWDNIVVNHHPKQGLLSKLRKESPPEMKQILKGVSGVAEPGKLTALMGSSGAGKTTLLNVLNQRGLTGLEVLGQVLLNGIPISEFGTATSKLIGYVQQHDILPEELTVREYLTFVAQLTMSKYLPDSAKTAKINEIIEEFSLRKCADTTIRGKQSVSGGERKRVSVASKLFAEPKLLFLDEPTTGLDSYMAALLVQNLEGLAAQGYNIICTIHQPSTEVFQLFDQLLLLADGRVTYFGPQVDSISYFSGMGYPCPDDFSPADYFIALLAIVPGQEKACLERVKRISAYYEKSWFAEKSQKALQMEWNRKSKIEDYQPDESETGYQASWCKQFRYIVWRVGIYLYRNPALLRTRALFVAFMCFIMMMMYWNPTATLDQTRVTAVQGLLYFFCANFTFVNASRVLVILPKELPLMIREHLDGLYCISAYYVGTFISQCSLGIVLLILSVTAVYFVGGLYPDVTTFFICIGILLLTYFANVGFAAMQSAIWEKPGRTVTLTTPQIFVMNVLGGFYINPRSIAAYLKPLVYIDWVPWSYELLNLNQWEDVTGIECEFKEATSCMRNGEDVIYRYGFLMGDYLQDFLLLAGQVTFYHMCTYAILRLKMKFKWSG